MQNNIVLLSSCIWDLTLSFFHLCFSVQQLFLLNLFFYPRILQHCFFYKISLLCCRESFYIIRKRNKFRKIRGLMLQRLTVQPCFPYFNDFIYLSCIIIKLLKTFKIDHSIQHRSWPSIIMLKLISCQLAYIDQVMCF